MSAGEVETFLPVPAVPPKGERRGEGVAAGRGGEVQFAAHVGELIVALHVYSKIAMSVLDGEEEEEADPMYDSDNVLCGGKIDLAGDSGEFFFCLFSQMSCMCPLHFLVI
jgi:hypothetical protein